MWKTKGITLIVLLLCTACSNAGNSNNINTSLSVVTSEDPNATIEIATDVKATTENEASEIATSTVDLMQKYIDFIQEDHDEQVAFIAKQDIDLDGYDEIVVAFGNSNEDPQLGNVTSLYLLRDREGDIVQLGNNLAGGGYGTYEVKLIQLQNKQQTYIYCGLTNGGGLVGFQIYELSDNEPILVGNSASATGSGDDELLDSNNDGQYDSYVQNRSSYDVLYYPMKRTFQWISDKNEFEWKESHVDMPEYPEQIQDLLYQYLSLRVLVNEDSPEINQRLSELCSYTQANDIKLEWEQWGSALYEYGAGSDDKLSIAILESTDTATATVTALVGESNKIALAFELVNLDGRWTISKLNMKR